VLTFVHAAARVKSLKTRPSSGSRGTRLGHAPALGGLGCLDNPGLQLPGQESNPDLPEDQLKRIESPVTTSDGKFGFFDFRYKVDGKKDRAVVEAEMSTERRTGFEGPVTVFFLPAESPDEGDE
jgi:hypothetical protein